MTSSLRLDRADVFTASKSFQQPIFTQMHQQINSALSIIALVLLELAESQRAEAVPLSAPHDEPDGLQPAAPDSEPLNEFRGSAFDSWLYGRACPFNLKRSATGLFPSRAPTSAAATAITPCSLHEACRGYCERTHRWPGSKCGGSCPDRSCHLQTAVLPTRLHFWPPDGSA